MNLNSLTLRYGFKVPKRKARRVITKNRNLISEEIYTESGKIVISKNNKLVKLLSVQLVIFTFTPDNYTPVLA